MMVLLMMMVLMLMMTISQQWMTMTGMTYHDVTLIITDTMVMVRTVRVICVHAMMTYARTHGLSNAISFNQTWTQHHFMQHLSASLLTANFSISKFCSVTPPPSLQYVSCKTRLFTFCWTLGFWTETPLLLPINQPSNMSFQTSNIQQSSTKPGFAQEGGS